MRTALIGCLLLLAGLAVGVVHGGQLPRADIRASGDLAVLESTQDRVVLELVPPSLVSEKKVAKGDTYQELRIPGWQVLSSEGRPQLPVRSVLVGVPPEADVRLDVVEVESEEMDGYDVYPAPRYVVPRPEPQEGPMGIHRIGELPSAEFWKDEEFYARDEFYPPRTALITDSGRIRRQSFVRLELRPFQFNPATGRLRSVRRMRVALEFSYPSGRSEPERETVDEPYGFGNLLQASIVNYDSARFWRTSPVKAESVRRPQAVLQPQYKVYVEADGLYEITHGALVAAGVIPGTITPAEIQLANRGQEVAIRVFGEDDGSFDEEDSILFYGEKAGTKYTDTNVYWLTFNGEEGLRMETLDGTPGTAAVPDSFWATLRFEKDRTYQPLYPEGSGKDHWFWDFIRIPPSRTYEATPEHPVAETYSMTLRVNMHGYRPVEHSVGITIAGHLVGRAEWSDAEEITATVQVHSPLVQPGLSELTLRAAYPDKYPDMLYLNQFEFDYQRTYSATDDLLLFSVDAHDAWKFVLTEFSTDSITVCNITDPFGPTLILQGDVTGGDPYHTVTFESLAGPDSRFIATTRDRWMTPQIEEYQPSDLHSDLNGADYIIIAPEEFHASLEPLAQHRASQGMRVETVNLEDIYDEFGFGLLDPEAIRDFLSHAYQSWTWPRPTYVLLAGDGHLDFKDNWGLDYPNPVPPYLGYLDTDGGETAADNRYVAVDGPDALPDMHVGRLPGNTPAEIQTMVQKIIDFEEEAPGTTWSGNLIFVSDNAETYPNDFPALSDLLADQYPSPAHRVTKAYLGDTCPYEDPSVICKGQYLDALNARGAMFLNYVGHGAPQYWSGEELLLMSDLPGFANGKKTYIHIAMTCNEGVFHYPSHSLGESVVRLDDRGAVAAWSPTGPGYTLGHSQLHQGFYSAFFWEGMRTLGDLTLAGKLRLHGSGINQELIDVYHLFGDPALRIPYHWAMSLPVVLRQSQ